MKIWKFPVPVLLLFALILPGSACGQNPASDGDRQASEVKPVAGGNTDASATRDLQERKKSAIAGLLMLGLLCGVFLVLLLFVVFWARRIRQAATAALPEQSPRDPLWYLRKNRSPVTGGSTSDQSEVEGDSEVR